MLSNYDVIVVGAGHAGCEAAVAAANLGSKVLLITMNLQNIAQMSCNPAMGGVAKGQIVREIDAMSGYSGIVSDKSAIQFRMLNRSKGPAMWSPRTQNDRMLFSLEWRMLLEQHRNIDFWQDTVKELIIKNKTVVGVVTNLDVVIYSRAVVLTNGTFLNGLIHIGNKNFGGGRAGESAVRGITEQLIYLGFESGRMKTGTPPRVDGRSLDYSKMDEQVGDENPQKFSFLPNIAPLKNQKSCFITYTNPEVHAILKEGFSKSPLFNGTIKGAGPRYCPSVEDKINRFSDKDRHQIFVEPEGWNTIEIYVNGFSTSLSEETQIKAIKKIPGFENAKLFRPGYAIEYDYFPPTQLKASLETKLINHLFFAGQINGTTGYEEAACQGLMAGINAHHSINRISPLILKRSDAYIGVLIDDLINKGTEEPYRMFTSRAEYRILLRQDNADLRLTPIADAIGLISSERAKRLNEKKQSIDAIINFLKTESASPELTNQVLISKETSKIEQKIKLDKLLLRPQIEIFDLIQHHPNLRNFISKFETEFIEEASIQIKYEGYIEKEREHANKFIELDNLKINDNFDYNRIKSLSNEGRQKLISIKPTTLGQAQRISGVSPADISVLMIYMGR